MSEQENLEQQLQDARTEIDRLKRTNELLKKRTLQAIIGNSAAEQCEQDRKVCEIGRAQAERSSHVKSVFLENVSHELRTSMTGIVGMNELLLRTELAPAQRGYLEMISSSVDRLMIVVSEMLDFSRIEAGDLELAPDDFNLKESLDHDLYVLSLSAQKKGLKLSSIVSPMVPAHVHGDAHRLIQILTNLINNAIKYTDEGEIRLLIDNVGYDSENRLRLRFSVVDSGTGIDDRQLAQIDHYFRQKVTPHEPQSLSLGSGGLGLTVTSQLVKLMGGDIGVESGRGGSTFWFELPFGEVADISVIEKKASETMENIKEDAAYALRGARILLAEDEEINRVLIETVLKQLGVVVTSVESGKQAVAEVCKGGYQLVLMDIQMDDMDGLDATRRIRRYERNHGGHIPVIALTALAMAGDREKCLQAGMDDYLAKPVERSEVVKLLASYLMKKALVVDDDPASCQVFVRTLVESGWQVTIADTRRLAMYEASLSHFDLIFFDLSSTNLGGLEPVRLIRELEKYSMQRAAVVGVGDDSWSDALPCSELDSFLFRPVTREKIAREIENL
ncbi:response regulator [Desulforhopalus singaporensis]|uniref:histidine kinase n=1 Tax=Desulforhopalus singaporensis TaxID=91360 RepID=A0A1H0V9W8_9BACT|nr:response regulator [Desulforhopalus singaporensis]SDP75144.1 Signal transduction histidine kinase [Desulforhopalus singaporensis]